MRIVRWLVLIIILGFLGLGLRDTYRGGYFSLPPLTDDQYPISFKSGLRAIVTVEDLRENSLVAPKIIRRLSHIFPDLRFFGVTYDVEFWLKGVWSNCRIPTESEVAELRASLPEKTQRNMLRATLSWICFIDVNGDQVFRGVIFTAPRL